MENLKVKVSSEAESKEAQGYFEDLGAVCCSGLERSKNVNFLFMNSGFVTACKLQENFDKSKCKEITLPELRDLVVLKRNDVGDATHTDPNEKESLYFRLFGEWWNLFTGGRWQQFCHMESPRAAKLKPIEKKEMKEYLVKSQDGKWREETTLTGDPADTVIEIPAGAELAVDFSNFYGENHISFYKRVDDFLFVISQNYKNWYKTEYKCINDIGFNDFAGILLWQRNQESKQAEFLVKTDGGYVLQVLDENSGGADVVRVPDGATAYVNVFESDGWKACFYDFGKKIPLVFCDNEWTDFNKNYPTLQSLVDDGDIILWQRETLNDQVASAEEYREMISNAASVGLTSVVVDIAQSCSGGASRNASSQGQSEFPLNNYELNHRVAKAFNAVRGTDLNEDDVNYLRELINLTVSHYGERK